MAIAGIIVLLVMVQGHPGAWYFGAAILLPAAEPAPGAGIPAPAVEQRL
jgi:hypothetical protein